MRKKVMFEESEDQFARFKLRLRYDRIKQGDFFRHLVDLYVRNDSTMVSIFEEYKKKNSTMGLAKIARSSREIEKGNEIARDLSLTPSDLDLLYDLINEEEID